MGLLARLRGTDRASHAPAAGGLARDARAMQATLGAMKMESGRASVDPRAMIGDLLQGEVAAPTQDVASLRRERLDPDDFYAREIGPSWDGLSESERATKLEGFLELCSMMEAAGDGSGLTEDMAARVRTKTLVLAWAFDETYGYLSRIARDEAPV
jgi:hypothetical protein